MESHPTNTAPKLVSIIIQERKKTNKLLENVERLIQKIHLLPLTSSTSTHSNTNIRKQDIKNLRSMNQSLINLLNKYTHIQAKVSDYLSKQFTNSPHQLQEIVNQAKIRFHELLAQFEQIERLYKGERENKFRSHQQDEIASQKDSHIHSKSNISLSSNEDQELVDENLSCHNVKKSDDYICLNQFVPNSEDEVHLQELLVNSKKMNEFVHFFDMIENYILLYDIKNEVFYKKLIPGIVVYFGMESVAIRNNIYFCGGADKYDNCYKTFYCLNISYSLLKIEWNLQQLVDMNKAKFRHSMLPVLNSKYIYCVGGADQKSSIDFCEKYNISDKSWEIISSLLEPREHGSMTEFNGKYLVYIGGLCQQEISNSTKCKIQFLPLLTEFGGWEFWEDQHNNMLDLVLPASIQTSATEIIVFGGWRNDEDLRQVYKLNMNLKTIEAQKSELELEDVFLGKPIYYDGDIYAFGNSGVHIFQKISKKWSFISE